MDNRFKNIKQIYKLFKIEIEKWLYKNNIEDYCLYRFKKGNNIGNLCLTKTIGNKRCKIHNKNYKQCLKQVKHNMEIKVFLPVYTGISYDNNDYTYLYVKPSAPYLFDLPNYEESSIKIPDAINIPDLSYDKPHTKNKIKKKRKKNKTFKFYNYNKSLKLINYNNFIYDQFNIFKNLQNNIKLNFELLNKIDVSKMDKLNLHKHNLKIANIIENYYESNDLTNNKVNEDKQLIFDYKGYRLYNLQKNNINLKIKFNYIKYNKFLTNIIKFI